MIPFNSSRFIQLKKQGKGHRFNLNDHHKHERTSKRGEKSSETFPKENGTAASESDSGTPKNLNSPEKNLQE